MPTFCALSTRKASLKRASVSTLAIATTIQNIGGMRVQSAMRSFSRRLCRAPC